MIYNSSEVYDYYMDIITCLENLGFTVNEAKVYTTLLRHKVLNGYEIAKLSGVSRSLVYEVIGRLVQKGHVFKLEGEPNFYRALEYGALIKKLREERESNLTRAEEMFKELSRETAADDYVVNIVGAEKGLSKARELIDGAQAEISLSIWKDTFCALKESLSEAVSRGVKVYIFTFEDIELEGATVFSYKIGDAHHLFPYLRTTLISDGGECLVGEDCGPEPIFICTRNHSVVSLATDEIVLNIFWYRYIEREGLLHGERTADDFLRVMETLADRLGINENMTKNFMVYNFQRRSKGEKEH